MGCGLRKLEDPEDSSPGKIYSTLKRPQVETKTETVYEYVLLDFSLEEKENLSSFFDNPSSSNNLVQSTGSPRASPAALIECLIYVSGGVVKQISKEMHVQPAEVAPCSSLSGNTDQVPKEMHVQPADVTMCRSLSDNTDQVPKEMHVQPADVTMCRSLSDNTDQSCEHGLVSEEMSSLEKCAICGGPLSPLKWNGERCKAVSENAEGKDKDPSRKVKVNEQSGSRPTVQYVASLSELPQALQPYYTQGYVLAALHPIILSVGRTRSLPFSLLYRAILARPRPSKQTASMCHSVPMLRVEEWPLPGESLTGDTVRALIDRVNSSARGGVRFIGSVLQQVSGITNGRVHSPKRGCRSPPRTPPGTPPGDRELEDNTYSPDLRLLVFFHSWAPGCAPLDSLACQYHQGALSMRVSRKGQVVSALEADWLELTAAYYRKGWSLVDSFVYWDTPKGEPVPRSLEGLFVYEERSTSPPANDTIVVEQWTVIEGSNVKTDYGPLLHTLAEFGWLLTCVLPTPIIRHDSDGNLATKQVVFLQRPVRSQAAGQPRNQPLSVHSDVSSRSVSRAVSSPVSPDELSPTAGGIGGFPVFGGGYPSALTHLEEGGFEQEEGKAEVTCM